ncbi:hypothetical protein GCM10008967_30620 [Bacillus carboniphilus]|uniref:Uncharacterized protein n=1 Tax=Bacillus carboniphilus TaxID=86663 RepID=A0ABN0WHV7_9BACI
MKFVKLIFTFSVLVFLTSCQSVTDEVDSITTYLQEDKPQDAIETFLSALENSAYSEEEKNEMKATTFPLFNEDIIDIMQNYKEEKIDYDTAILQIKQYEAVNHPEVLEVVNNHITEVNSIKEARGFLEAGLQLAEDKEYKKALDTLLKINRETVEYDTAFEKMQEIKSEYYEVTLNKADEFFGNGEYEKAILLLEDLKVYFPLNPAIDQDISYYIETLIQIKINEADRFALDNKFADAFATLDSLDSIIGPSDITASRKEQYASLEHVNKYELILSPFVDQINQFHDKEYATIYLTPKNRYPLVEELATGEAAFYPRLSISPEGTVLEMVAGYGHSEELIQVQDILIKIDDMEPFDFYLEDGDIQQKQDETGAYEWVRLDERENGLQFLLLQSIADSLTTEITFEGYSQSKTFQVTAQDKAAINLFLDILEALGEGKFRFLENNGY